MQLCDNKVLVLADDFTGANDAGVSLAETGMRVDVAFDEHYQGDAQALILNSDSRALTKTEAVRRVSALLQKREGSVAPRWAVKKIDSTLRGNVGAEIETMMQALACSLAIVAPAYPSAGRVTQGGRCYVNGVLLTETEFASDPKTPVTHADIATLITQQSQMPCRAIALTELDTTLCHSVTSGEIAIVDAQTDADLDAIIAGIARRQRRVLLVGSGGVCDALARHLAHRQHGPLLAVVGSMSEIAQRQIAVLHGHPRVRQITIDVEQAFTGVTTSDAQRIAEVIQRGLHCVVTTTVDAQTRERISEQCRVRGVTRAELGERVCRHLAQLVKAALHSSQPGALYLSGGDVAIAVATALNATGFQITGRVAQCVPYGHFLGSHWQRPVMTKAGGFGSETTLREVVDSIEEKMSD